jgi:hypothetical protein
MKGFLETFKVLRDGAAEADMNEHLEAMVAAVRETGRAGAITLTLKVRPASKGDVRVLTVEDLVKVTRPQPERGATVLFTTDDNQLQRNDPRQPELRGLREATPIARGKDAAFKEA